MITLETTVTLGVAIVGFAVNWGYVQRQLYVSDKDTANQWNEIDKVRKKVEEHVKEETATRFATEREISSLREKGNNTDFKLDQVLSIVGKISDKLDRMETH